MSTAKPHSCPFEGSIRPAADGVSHVEGRFSALETQVSGLERGLENMERAVSEGFKSVFSKIDSIGVTRAANTVPWIMIGFAVLGLIATVGFQSINGVTSIVIKAEANLALANTRELQYREDKGRSEERAMQLGNRIDEFQRDYRLQHQELRIELQRDMAILSKTVDDRAVILSKTVDDRATILAEQMKLLQDRQWTDHERKQSDAGWRAGGQ